MVKIRKQEIVTFSFIVGVTGRDIDEGKCRDPHRCMERVAIQRALESLLGEGKVERLRLDGAQIKFNYDGYRWAATTPKTAKKKLIEFDHNRPVGPHHYKVIVIRGTKIQKANPQRQEQINRARRARVAAGTPDKKHTAASLHARVIGLGAV